MRVLILTQYFPPETGAPQNRLHSLAIHLAELGIEISVLTAMPNYPRAEVFKGYKGKFFVKENYGSIKIFRSFIYVRKSISTGARLINYFSFVISSALIGWVKTGRQDLIICESPPLFLGMTALFLKRIKKAKLVFNVSDLWPESVEKLGIIKSKPLLKIAYRLEKHIYKRANLVSGQTKGIVRNIETRFPEVNTFLFRNGIDIEQFNIFADGNLFKREMNISETDFVLVYAGILGYAQGLETVLDAAEILKSQPAIKFFIVGDGPEKETLIKMAKEKMLHNVVFIENKPRTEIPDIIAACDAYLVPLKKLDLFLSAIPSKIFEPLAMSKPIILGVDGEARAMFIEEGRCGLFYTPEDSSNLAQCINDLYMNRALALELGRNGKLYVMQYFKRNKIAKEFYDELVQLN